MTRRNQTESFATSYAWDEDSICVGDLVCTGANIHPNHEIIAVYGDKAWVRDLRNGADGVTSLSRCHKVHGLPPNRLS